MKYCGNLYDTDLKVEDSLEDYIQKAKWMNMSGAASDVTPWTVVKDSSIDVGSLYTGARTIIPTWLTHKVGSGVTVCNFINDTAVINSETYMDRVVKEVEEDIRRPRSEKELVGNAIPYSHYQAYNLRYQAIRLGFWPDIAEYFEDLLASKHTLGENGYISVSQASAANLGGETMRRYIPNLQVVVRSSGHEFFDKMNEKFLEIAERKATKSKPGKLTNSLASDYRYFLYTANDIAAYIRRSVIDLLQEKVELTSAMRPTTASYLFRSFTYNCSLSSVSSVYHKFPSGSIKTTNKHSNNLKSHILISDNRLVVPMVNDNKRWVESVFIPPNTEFSVDSEFLFPVVLPEGKSAEDVASLVKGFINDQRARDKVSVCKEPELSYVATAR